MDTVCYFVDVYVDTEFEGTARFMSKEAALNYIQAYSDGATYFELFEAKLIER